MSGDSPNSHTNDIFDFKDRSSPIPTTSKDIAVQSGPSIVTASVLVEPSKVSECKPDEPGVDSPVSSVPDDVSSPERTLKLDDTCNSGDQNPDKQPNGLDKLDGVWIPPVEEKKLGMNEDDEGCAVKCLYYTMQCCECTIM